MKPMLRVGIIGAGKIGAKRAEVLRQCSRSRLVAVVDQDETRARSVAQPHGASVRTDWRQLLQDPSIDAVVVAATHQWLAPMTLASLKAHKHVLCEKPLAMTAEDAQSLAELAASNGTKLKTGFNHRLHPAIHKAHEYLEEGRIGEVLHIRCRYGHGGRTGYDREWRADPSQSGGGELMDQGIHALDLFRWFMGEFSQVFAVLRTEYWNMPVEDNCYCTLTTPKGRVATLHASWTQWKNIFSFEVFGDRGYLLAEGLGGNYGPERLVWGCRREQGPPGEEVVNFDDHDVSWELEWQEFLSAIEQNRRPLADGYDGWQALRLVGALYESSRLNIPISLR